MQDLIDKIEALKNMDKSNYPVEAVKGIFNEMGKVGSVVVKLHPGKVIMRARMNKEDEIFYSKCQLTYTPSQFNKSYQRASTPDKTMFYGSIIPEFVSQDELNNARVIGIVEAIPWLREKGVNGIQNLTFGKWIVKEDLNLLAIVFEKDHYEKSSYTREIVDYFEKFMIAHPELVDKTIAVNDFFANEFSKEDINHDHDYLISALFTEMAVSRGFDGVFYPSVRTSGKGFNLAITPYAADNKLDLRAVGECKVYKKDMQWFADNIRGTELYPNQVHFEMFDMEPPVFVGEEESLRRVGAKSIDELRNG